MLSYEKFPRTAGIEDPRVRRTLTPVRVVTVRGCVKDAERLTEEKPLQVEMSYPRRACILENGAQGERAAVLLDFGIELHGSLTISVWYNRTTTAPQSVPSTVTLRIRTGESVSEALTPSGSGVPPTITPPGIFPCRCPFFPQTRRRRPVSGLRTWSWKRRTSARNFAPSRQR